MVFATLEVLVMHLGRVAEVAKGMVIDNFGLLFWPADSEGYMKNFFSHTLGASLAQPHGSSKHEFPFR